MTYILPDTCRLTCDLPVPVRQVSDRPYTGEPAPNDLAAPGQACGPVLTGRNGSRSSGRCTRAELCREYPENQPPVDWYHQPVTDAGVPATSLSVAEDIDDRGTETGQCTFAVHGVCADQIADMSKEERNALLVRHLRDKGRVLAYGHADNPESIFHNPQLFPGMFPWLFPYGLGGFDNLFISVAMPRRTHIRWCLNYHDRRFQLDEYFPFIVFNQEQIRACSKGGFALTERRNYESVVEKILNVDEDVLEELVRRGKEDGYVRPQTDKEKQCYELIQAVDHVAGRVAASGTKKKYQRNEIRSLIIERGVPMFFITFSPTESRSPICMRFCGQDVNVCDFLPMETHDRDRLRTAVANPVASAKFFDFMVKLFVKHILRPDSTRGGLFGPTEAYYGTVEQQGRTTLHLHLLLWIKGSCSPQQIRDR
ncbi:hypothetical protein EIP86_007984 [Pleurotus ostreatoroseus]|nr:hypothetical protein EIP86_007984 [Pleurotus ostreatoroseus]